MVKPVYKDEADFRNSWAVNKKTYRFHVTFFRQEK